MTVNPTYALLPDWPQARLIGEPPTIDDQQSAPTPALLLPQILALTPRGAAWGTDEAGSADRVSPVMAQYWTAIAGWVVDLNTREFVVAAQAIPSLATMSLGEWELELGLPEPGNSLGPTPEARLAAIRMLVRGVSDTSPAEFIALAAAGGATITIEEPDQFQCEVTELGPAFADPAPLPSDVAVMAPLCDDDSWSVLIVHVVEIGPLGSIARLQRLLERFLPLHLRLVLVDG